MILRIRFCTYQLIYVIWPLKIIENYDCKVGGYNGRHYNFTRLVYHQTYFHLWKKMDKTALYIFCCACLSLNYNSTCQLQEFFECGFTCLYAADTLGYTSVFSQCGSKTRICNFFVSRLSSAMDTAQTFGNI